MKKYSLEIFTIIMTGMIIYCAVSFHILCSTQRIAMAYMILFILHEWEENRFPGGFAELMAKFFGLNITQKQERLSHIPVYALIFIVTMVPFFTNITMLVLVPVYLGLFEAVVHVVGIRIHKMKKPYTPGMVTALLLGAASLIVLIICSEKQLVQGAEYAWGALLMFVCFAIMQRTVIAIFGLGYRDLIANVKLKIKSNK